MSSEKIVARSRIWFWLGGALLVALIWWAIAGIQLPVAAPSHAIKSPFVRLAGVGLGGDEQLMRERSELFDPAPLFFPTEWNFSQRPLPAGMHKLPGQIFESFEANFTMGEQGMKLYGADAFATPERLGEILAQGNAGSFAGMGQLDPSHKALTQRSLSIEVVKLSNGKTVIFNQDNDLNPQGLNIKPMIFLVAVSNAGLIGDPVFVPELGQDDVDDEVGALFRSYLIKSFRLGERLSAGRYRVVIGP